MIDVFIAYSHNDLHHKDELKKFLRPLLREGRISMWDDFDIEAGQDWDAKIKERLYGADLVLLLVSADSLASDYFYGKEVKVSLECHARGETVVVPVILRHCDWTETPLGALEALPEKGRPVVDWPTRDQALQDVVSRLRRVVEGIEQKRKTETSQAESRRQFGAACEAADHLFQKKNWAEARTAYGSALTAHQSGFTPDRATLLARIADCDAQLTALAIEAQRIKEAEAQQAKEAEVQRKRGEKERLAEQKQQLLESTKLSESSTPTGISPIARLLLGIGAGAGLVLVLLLWPPWKGGNTKRTPGLLPDTEAADFAAAKASSTLPDLRGFIQKKYPKEEFEEDARQLVQLLERKVNTLLNDAAHFSDDPDTACDLLGQAAVIAPDDTRVRKAKKVSKCK